MPAIVEQAALLPLRRVKLTLPVPPSANDLYRGGYGKTEGRARFLMPEQKQFRSTVIGIVRVELGRFEPLAGRLRLVVELEQKDNRRCDISNRIKALEDALQHAGVYADDGQIDRLEITRRRRRPLELCRVTVEELTFER